MLHVRDYRIFTFAWPNRTTIIDEARRDNVPESRPLCCWHRWRFGDGQRRHWVKDNDSDGCTDGTGNVPIRRCAVAGWGETASPWQQDQAWRLGCLYGYQPRNFIETRSPGCAVAWSNAGAGMLISQQCWGSNCGVFCYDLENNHWDLYRVQEEEGREVWERKGESCTWEKLTCLK